MDETRARCYGAVKYNVGCLEALGATPQARAKLGVTTGRALDLARLMAEAEAKREGGETDERDTDQVEG